MQKIFNHTATVFLAAAAICFSACKKEKYAFGDLKTPANLVLTAAVAGADAANPAGDGSGIVVITVKGDNALTYNVDFGDGTTKVVPTGEIEYRYTQTGTHDYTITVNAVGTGGIMSTISKTVTVYFAFVIPADIMAALTGGSSKVWMSDKDAGGHFGVGPADGFEPIWYAADPNSRLPCSYDDEITFTKAGDNAIDMQLNNFGQSFAIGGAAAFYGLASAEDCRDINPGGVKRLSFVPASSASTPAQSTRVEFGVPGNGLLIFGTGATVYEILSISETSMHIRNIGIDGNAWYQKLKAK
ncbi:MAG TPA: PKD domain-containing protein [Ferruginibacter sp.]|nr:PKD domain-containing protein [Ferruginibacter sp.]HMP19420.1 PKD domain-containing protein [Ferruginibacter sp.]